MKLGSIVRDTINDEVGMILKFVNWHWPNSSSAMHKKGRSKKVKKVKVISQGCQKIWLQESVEVICE